MPIKAFQTRRVLEALNALGGYLEQAVDTADGIPPGEVPDINLPETVPESVSPRVLSVLFGGVSRKITLPNGDTDNGTTTVELVVSGDDLQNPKLFKLVGVGPNAPTFESTAFSNEEEDEFTVTVDIKEPSAGLYDAKFVNIAGQYDILNRACRIKAAPDDYDNSRSSPGARKALPAKTTTRAATKNTAARKRARKRPKPSSGGQPPPSTD
jgi:hypothetical protein